MSQTSNPDIHMCFSAELEVQSSFGSTFVTKGYDWKEMKVL